MCGIAGIVTRDGSAPSEALLRRMSERVAHRGPDGDRIRILPGVGLAHRRLAIIDLSPEAAQPMPDTGGTLTIVFNGEIYNYRGLRLELEKRGARFRTQSDTEVILEAYRAWGNDAFTKFRGMFALAIWDASARRLTLARDKIGKKPLFFTTTPSGDLAFASEIKSLAPAVSLKPDWNAVRLFLGLQYVPSPLTGFVGVQQLLPGEIGTFDEKGWRTQTYHQWDVGAHAMRPDENGRTIRENGRMTREDGRTTYASEEQGRTAYAPTESIRSLIEDATKIRLLASDVPVGAFLSGGIDSAAIVAFASRHVSKPLQTFTMGFPSMHLDERGEARMLAKHFATDHHEFEARPEHLAMLLDELIEQYDAPYADSSALPVWFLSRETAKDIKVVLTGDGGDEAFGGYKRYVAYAQAMMLAKIPFAGRASGVGSRASFAGPKWKRFLETVAASSDPARGYGELFCGSYFNTSLLRETFDSNFLEETKDADAVGFVASSIRKQGACHAPLQDAMHFDLTSYLPDDLNVKMDRATMRWGLEARAPFLDQDVVAFALGLPLNEKVHHGKTKIALRRALRGIVPDRTLSLKKRGFQVPLAEWFRGSLSGVLRDRILDSSSPIARLVRRDAVTRLIEENAAGKDHGNRLWMLLSLATWLERYP